MIHEIKGRYTCSRCGYEWSAMCGDKDIPKKCECEKRIVKDTTNMKIGDAIWIHNGVHTGEESTKWTKHIIVGETNRSWIVRDEKFLDAHWAGKKLPKIYRNNMEDDVKLRFTAFTEEEVKQKVWVAKNSHHIQSCVSVVHDYETLKKIADLVGFFREE